MSNDSVLRNALSIGIATGVYSVKTTHRTGQTYRVKWTAPDGKLYTGPAVQGY